MAEPEIVQIFLDKAEESLTGARSEFVNRRYNNAVNRCYYACFQVAIAALTREGIGPRGNRWGHAFVQAQFNGELINRRRVYVSDLRNVLNRAYALRQTADYTSIKVSRDEVEYILGRTREFVEQVQERGGRRA